MSLNITHGCYELALDSYQILMHVWHYITMEEGERNSVFHLYMYILCVYIHVAQNCHFNKRLYIYK